MDMEQHILQKLEDLDEGQDSIIDTLETMDDKNIYIVSTLNNISEMCVKLAEMIGLLGRMIDANDNK
jgi:hypothetical protein